MKLKCKGLGKFEAARKLTELPKQQLTLWGFNRIARGLEKHNDEAARCEFTSPRCATIQI
ncbi:MAG TPA: hypothetical protein VGP72_16285 [Planctomycetota bacterium]|jgi:hypothetical protein